MEIIGVDIGGSHIAAASVSRVEDQVEIGELVDRNVDTFSDAKSIIDTWSQVIQSVKEYSKTSQIAIAMPGPFDYDQGISMIHDQGKMKTLFGCSICDLLADSLGISPQAISFTNDAEAFLIGESQVGAGRSFSNSIGLTLGTGLGSAIQVEEVVKDAQLWRAPFKDGIAEDYLGTAWFVNYAEQNYRLKIKGVKDLLNEEISSEIRKLIFAEFGKNLGEFLFPYLIRLQTQVLILGGKISLASSEFVPFVRDFLEHRQVSIPIIRSELEEHAALIGAAISHQEKMKSIQT
ncbi:ROK family protein [Algoriphagus hitonicola]|uniref:Glucokinase n=1 Tax=Algoriphagus hitonicola TaxID=435880 RepID=A0A1I2X5K9_9BACT|nr:ROK family protein [Algoriphagus hitonicola]SFH08824.1 glucokinase [Algoriphagus hitonicola]